MYGHSTPGRLSVCNTVCYECDEKFVYRFFINIVYLKAVWLSREHYISFGCSILGDEYESSIATTCFRRWVPVNSNHLNNTFCSKVASSNESWMHVFNAFVSSILKLWWLVQNEIILCAKSVRVQHYQFIPLLSGYWLRKPPKKTSTIAKQNVRKLDFSCGWEWKRDRNKTEKKERKKTTLHLLCILADVG